MEVTASQVKQQLDGHEKHCEERHQVINTTLTRLSNDVIQLTSDVENIKENLREIREDMRGLRRDVDAKIDGLRDYVDSRIDGLRKEMASQRSEMRWLMGMGVGFLSLLFTATSIIG